jgi:hypothetical protein
MIEPDENAEWKYMPARMDIYGFVSLPGQEHCTVVQEDGSKMIFRRYPKLEPIAFKSGAPIQFMLLNRRDIEYYGLQKWMQEEQEGGNDSERKP